VLCGCLLGSQESSQPDLKPAKPASSACKKNYTQPRKMKENPCFLGQELSARKREYRCVKIDLSKQVMLAKNDYE